MEKFRKYKVVTINYKNSHLKVMGQFAIQQENEQQVRAKLEQLKADFHLDELVYLATCNRILFLISSPDSFSSASLEAFFKNINPKLSATEIAEHILYYEGQAALRHVYSVAASVDSLVVGEREILRQFRTAYEKCSDWNLTGDNLRLLMRFAVMAGKEVYAKTRIGEKPVSVVSLAIRKMLRHHLPPQSRVLLIGAGQTNTLVAKFLAKHAFQVTVFNRTLKKAQKLANLLFGTAHTLDELNTYKKGFDVMIVCTGSGKAIIDKTLYQNLLRGETDRKIVIDLAVPNNIQRDVTGQFDMEYIEVETLRALAKENLGFREKEVHKANDLLDQHLLEFETHYQQRRLERAMSEVPKKIKAIKSHAMNEVFRQEVEALDENTQELVSRMLDYMEKKCISIPMTEAKKAVLK